MTLAVAKQLHTQLGKVIAEAEQSAT